MQMETRLDLKQIKLNLNLINQFWNQHHPRFLKDANNVVCFLEGDVQNQKRYEVVLYEDIDDLLAQLYAKPE